MRDTAYLPTHDKQYLFLDLRGGYVPAEPKYVGIHFCPYAGSHTCVYKEMLHTYLVCTLKIASDILQGFKNYTRKTRKDLVSAEMSVISRPLNASAQTGRRARVLHYDACRRSTTRDQWRRQRWPLPVGCLRRANSTRRHVTKSAPGNRGHRPPRRSAGAGAAQRVPGRSPGSTVHTCRDWLLWHQAEKVRVARQVAEQESFPEGLLRHSIKDGTQSTRSCK